MNIEQWDRDVQDLKKFLNSLGVNTVVRASKQVSNLKLRNSQLEQYVKEVCSLLGSDNIGNALKRLRTLTSGASTLPPELQIEPDVWLTGSTNRVTRMDWKVARREYLALLPMITAVYNDIDTHTEPERTDILSAFIEGFQTSSPDELYVQCRNYLRDSDISLGNFRDPDPDPDPLASELLSCYKMITETPNYGVVSELPTD
jgi:hypothetical protein